MSNSLSARSGAVPGAVQAKVAVIVGSLRKQSFSRRVAQALSDVAPAGLNLEIVELGQLPMFDQDFDDEGRTPASWASFRDTIKGYDAVLFVTPEYNRSLPAVIKNAIDIGSRPYGQSVWNGKPAAVVSVSPGPLGGFGANHHLRQSLAFLNMPVLQQEAYVGNAATLFGDDGAIANDGTREFFRALMAAFAGWIGKTRAEAPPTQAAA